MSPKRAGLSQGMLAGAVQRKRLLAAMLRATAEGETEGLDSLLPSLMYFAVLPYEGHEVASEELALAAG